MPGWHLSALSPGRNALAPPTAVAAIVSRASRAFSQIKDGLVFPFNLPAIIELGTATGFDFELIDQANLGP
ncbi:Acriflavine resistance protein B [Leclercia adecarboxylata]|uniref:Acriflavine resistance protein B n=1 Tax=Leclercia adecarboxylata TaxID=83655 RepID=A0A4U9IRG7_9ENTR|nr:Acriflavine resistance protein B [Leclercia adecarboxylata]